MTSQEGVTVSGVTASDVMMSFSSRVCDIIYMASVV